MTWRKPPPWARRNRNGEASKFGNRTSRGLDGRSYHSALEASVSNWLLAQEKAGEIQILKRQQHIHFFSLDVKLCEYWPDFTVKNLSSGEIYWIEAKGKENTDWLIKLNLWRAGGPGRLDLIKGDWKAPRLVESITPQAVNLHVRPEQVFGRLT